MQPPLKEIVSEIKSLEPFPDVAARVLELAAKEDVVPEELIEVIQMDPGLMAKVLKLCNSAYYGFQREIASLRDAGNLLGVSTLVNLVLTSSANKYFRNYGRTTPQSQRDLWSQSVTNAIAARRIAERNERSDPERAYTAGLLQNIGNLVLERFYQASLDRVAAVAQAGYSLIEAEKHALGLHHAEIGARLASRWSLPELLADTIRFHHAPELATVDPMLTATVHLAETLAAVRVAADDAEPELSYEVSESALEMTGMDPGDFEGVEDAVARDLEAARELFEI